MFSREIYGHRMGFRVREKNPQRRKVPEHNPYPSQFLPPFLLLLFPLLPSFALLLSSFHDASLSPTVPPIPPATPNCLCGVAGGGEGMRPPIVAPQRSQTPSPPPRPPACPLRRPPPPLSWVCAFIWTPFGSLIR